jgi:hypothetical protein
MEEYEFEVHLRVKAAAFSENDARELLEDTFGLGEDCGVTIESREINGPK